MINPWKLATLGIALAGVTAVSTGVTTAYLMRPAPSSDAAAAAVPAAPTTAGFAPSTATAPVPRAPRPARAASAPAAMVSPAVASPPAVATRPAAIAAPPAVVTQAPVVMPASAPVPDDCSTGGQRAMKIAKPGLIGTIAGAGLGAIGGAIADGGSGAGKGALIGGLAGAALGGGYGAYKTSQECGTIFGNAPPGFASVPTVAGHPAVAPQAALHEASGRGITVYHAR